MIISAYRESYCALRRLATLSRSRHWKIILLYNWSSRVFPSLEQVRADYGMAERSAIRWINIIKNSVDYGKNRKYTLRCNNHARIYLQQSLILKRLLEQMETL